jgi:murein DD-endopeptidase MepM/ murein hydrolase activator NlpD
MNPRFLRLIYLCAVLVMASLSEAAKSSEQIIALEQIRGEAVQGDMVIYRTQPGTEVFQDGEAVAVSAQGYFAIGFHHSDVAPRTILLRKNGQTKTVSLTPQARVYEIERIDGLARQMVTPDKALMDRIAKDRQDVRDARAKFHIREDVFIHGIDWPVTGRITGIYGSRRILNGEERQPHYGIDIAVPTGTAIVASADGIIRLAHDLYFTGGTIIIDHGFGLNTTYSHLSEIRVRPDQNVKRGEVIGTAGSTGRSTGPHLDWRVNLGTKRLDPERVAHAPDHPSPRPRPASP